MLQLNGTFFEFWRSSLPRLTVPGLLSALRCHAVPRSAMMRDRERIHFFSWRGGGPKFRYWFQFRNDQKVESPVATFRYRSCTGIAVVKSCRERPPTWCPGPGQDTWGYLYPSFMITLLACKNEKFYTSSVIWRSSSVWKSIKAGHSSQSQPFSWRT